MASDDDYMAFLNKANEDPSKGVANTSTTSAGSKKQLKATEEGVSLPEPIANLLKKGDAFYVSDADEPFEGVALKTSSGSLPTQEDFANLTNHWSPSSAAETIDILDPIDWNSSGQYGEVIDAVREAAEGGDVRVYRVDKGDGVRAEYWVVGILNKGDGQSQLVGVRALAVES